VTIVGVAADSKYSTLNEAPTPFVYRPIAQQWTDGQTLFVRVTGDPAVAMTTIQEVVSAIDPRLPRVAGTTLAREASMALLPQRVAAAITGALGVTGLLLAAIGLYGMMSYGVSLRLREIGVRLALGARGADVVGMMLTQGIWLTVAGALIGLAGAAFATRFVASYLLNVSSMVGVAFGGAAILLLCVALLAAFIPARRAATADPLVVLRSE
jgi:ABC-type antimicrobial peptide transport system permease subunit